MTHLTLENLQSASDAFYAALAEVLAGDATAMIDLWSHQTDVSYLGPMSGDLFVGWDVIEPEWRSQAAAQIEGAVVTEDMHYVVGGPLGIVVNYEVGSGHKGISETMKIRVTSTYRLEDGQVRMIGHHTDRF
ncbi:MAG: nuclear transport factor 2 family protein [Actinomycetia bacterium]|nr:nuclear transport factor 2 family protein [Actinomycetes bacterium]